MQICGERVGSAVESTNHRHGIAWVGPESLKPGGFYELLRHAEISVIGLSGEPRALRLWRELWVERKAAGPDSVQYTAPSEAGFFDLVRNHASGEKQSDLLGDMLLFRHRSFAYVGRKINLVGDGDNGAVVPERLLCGERPISLAHELRREIWALGTDLLRALCPRGVNTPRATMTIQWLCYPDDWTMYEETQRLIDNCVGRWSQIGRRLDEYEEEAAHCFRSRFLKMLYVFGRASPKWGKRLQNLTSRQRLKDARLAVPVGYEVIGGMHADVRLYSALMSERINLRTEFWHQGRWECLPYSPGCIFIIPGLQAFRGLKIRPVVHRVLLRKEERSGDESSSAAVKNVTICLGAKQGVG